MDKFIYEYDTDNIEYRKVDSLFKAREEIISAYSKFSEIKSDVTIKIQAFNRLEKTKQCIESVLKYTKGIDYDLLLIDSGSTDGTFEYFKSIKHDKVRVIRLSKNVSSSFPLGLIPFTWISKYMVALANDLIVTENWLSNLIKVAESDEKIGMVNPISSNVSNLQMYNMKFDNYEDMHLKAAEFNKSDSSKWHERLRLITLGTLYKKECLSALGWPHGDYGFVHDFGDDDITFRVRRAGYKAILAGDTWIHHNHNIFALEDKDPQTFHKSLEIGRLNFQEKYFGIDAWNDAGNYTYMYIDKNFDMPVDRHNVRILGIDVKCGMPILDVKNLLRKFDVFNVETSAYTSQSKYDIDLKTICNGKVVCDRIDYIKNIFINDFFDYIIIDKCINEYADFESTISNIYSLLKKGGQMYFKFKNTFNLFTLLELLGHNVGYSEKSQHSKVENFYKLMKEKDICIEIINREVFSVEKQVSDYVLNIIKKHSSDNEDENFILNKLMINNYWIKITRS
ncbi:MAG: glycosyltransferase family 2 protein [Ruminococcus sp.]|nr:glycosyltransferase family 2 protein [Ruminococcus sp.]